MKNINFVYHIGERCNLLAHLVNSNLLSGMNCFSGLYISFNSVIDIIKNDYNNFENNIVKFKILQLKNIEDNSIVFIRCIDYDQEELNKIKNLILNCDWNFFYKENYYDLRLLSNKELENHYLKYGQFSICVI